MRSDTQTETWRPVPGWVGVYEVSSHGRVRSLSRIDARGRYRQERLLKAGPNPEGYPQFTLSRGSLKTVAKVHKVVMDVFVGPCPVGMEVLHRDGNPANNRLSNLQYGTRSQNVRDSIRHGTNVNASKTHCPQGHVYDEANTYIARQGRAVPVRECRTCKADRQRRYKAKRRALQMKED